MVHALGDIASIYAGFIIFCKYIACIPVTAAKVPLFIEVMLYLMTTKESLSNPDNTLINTSQWVNALLPALFSAGHGFFCCGRC